MYIAPGKIMLTGEYAALYGAKVIAFPTKLSQNLKVSFEISDASTIHWVSKDLNAYIWFENHFILDKEFLYTNHEDTKTSNWIVKLLNYIYHHYPDIIINKKIKIETFLEFDRNWGFGSSSSLIGLLAQWVKMDLKQSSTFFHSTTSGSGYDVAIAINKKAFIFENKNKNWIINDLKWNPNFINQIWLIYRGHKVESALEIKNKPIFNQNDINTLNEISNKLISCQTLHDFENLIEKHEKIISKYLNTKTLKQELFNDYKGAIKSLGAWGGDFFLATGLAEDVHPYFANKNFKIIKPFREIININ